MQTLERLSVISHLQLPTYDFVIGNSTAAAANGVLPEIMLYQPDTNSTDPNPLVIHDLDIYTGKNTWNHLCQEYPVTIRQTHSGNYPGEFPVINPTGEPDIEIFPAFNYPFDGHTLPGSNDIFQTAGTHNFGSGIGLLPVMDPEVILTIEEAFGRPQDKSRAKLIRKKMAKDKELIRKPQPSRPTIIFSAKRFLPAA